MALSAVTVEPDPWPTVDEAARQLGTSTRTIARWIAEKKIATRRRPEPGRKPLVLVDPQDIERIRAEQQTPVVLPPETIERRADVETRVLDQIPQMMGQLAQAIVLSRTGGPKPAFLTLSDASEYCALPVGLLRRLIRKKRLPALQYSGTFYLLRNDIDNFAILQDVSD